MVDYYSAPPDLAIVSEPETNPIPGSYPHPDTIAIGEGGNLFLGHIFCSMSFVCTSYLPNQAMFSINVITRTSG